MSVLDDILGFFGLITTTPISPYPARAVDPLQVDTKLQNALLDAVHKAEANANQANNSFPIPMVIIDITGGSKSFPMAGWSEWEQDYIASEAKVGVLYAAYAFRDMVQRYANAKSLSNASTLFAQIGRDMNNSIVDSVPTLKTAAGVTDNQRLPTYANVVTATPSSPGLAIAFSPAYDAALEQMIVPSSNDAARDCIHGLGYSYVNGALAAGGFFNLSAGRGPIPGPGIWVAGDYQMGTKWPYARLVTSRNDGASAFAATPRSIAQLILAIVTQPPAIDQRSSNEMLLRMSHAAQGVDTPFISRDPRVPVSKITANKLGYGPIGRGPTVVCSECSVIKEPVAAGRTYVVAWQNLLGTEDAQQNFVPSLYAWSDMTTVFLDTVTKYES